MRLRLQKIKKHFTTSNVALYIFALIVLAITWSGIKTIQSNYELQKQVSVLKQQNAVLDLQNQNTKLKNQYYATDQYLDLAARQDLGLAAPGEQVLLISKATALKYTNPAIAAAAAKTTSVNTQPQFIKNIEAWRDFLLGRSVSSD
jgi:cell division protein FtsB